MIFIKELNSERRDFIFSLVSLHSDMKVVASPVQEEIAIHKKDFNATLYMSYEDFVGQYYKEGVDLPIGSMMLKTNGARYVKLPTTSGNSWNTYDSMEDNAVITTTPVNYSTVKQFLGKVSNKKGYFDIMSRTVLYDSSWVPVELTIEQIAEKFGVKPEQIRIKK